MPHNPPPHSGNETTELRSDLVEAFRETEYRVQGDASFVLRIGQCSEALQAAHRRHRCDSSAFITAWNPFSAALDSAQNATRQEQLVEEVRRRGLTFWLGVGQHPSNGWDGEDSLLVFGLDAEAAKALGRRFEQNAIIWNDADGIAHLVLLR